jgi:hypothetical protein
VTLRRTEPVQFEVGSCRKITESSVFPSLRIGAIKAYRKGALAYFSSENALEEVLVVSNCANPSCAAPLRYLRDGRLYQFEVKSTCGDWELTASTNNSRKQPVRQMWHFWLCGQCSSSLTLSFDQNKGLRIVPLR